MKSWNCSFYGDFPEDFCDFCVRECPVATGCIALHTKQYPLEAWRVVAEVHKREVWLREVKKK